jgi:hypothetical protein
MAYEDVNINGTFFKLFCHEPVAQGFYTGTQIKDHEPVIRPYFEAGSISAVNYRS